MSCLKYPTPAIGGLFYGVSSGSGLGRASNTRSENKNLYLETDEFASTPPFSKKPLAGAFRASSLRGNLLAGTFQKNIWREFFKKYLAGTFKTHIWREQFQKHIWREHFGGNILRGTFFFL
jgi:hypothetical protein